MTNTEHKFLFIGMRKGFATCLAYLAETADEALAKCQKLNPDFEIYRWDLAEHIV